MGSKPRQKHAQSRPFDVTHPGRGTNLNDFLTPRASKLQSSWSIRPGRVVRTAPWPEVVQECNRMAREIHDTLVQEFAGILLHLEAANSSGHAQRRENICEHVARAKELAKCGLEDARRILLGLRPKPLEGADFCDALRQLAQNFSHDCGIQCSFCLRGRKLKLPEDAENELYRVAQEALCNVRKHSRAHSVSLLLRYGSSGVLLAIKDNGQGFLFEDTRAGAHGFGLPAMSDRALRFGGRVDVNSRPGAGTELKVTVPMLGKTSTERNNR
jgi:signal transduction histidine kinase